MIATEFDAATSSLSMHHDRPRSPRMRGSNSMRAIPTSPRKTRAFTLVEVTVAVALVAIGFLGAFAMVLQSGRLVSAAEEEALVCSGLEQRIDQLRELSWPALTDGTGVTGSV